MPKGNQNQKDISMIGPAKMEGLKTITVLYIVFENVIQHNQFIFHCGIARRDKKFKKH